MPAPYKQDGRLRLAMISPALPVPGLKRGGIERVAHVLADGLAARGHDVAVFSHDPRPDGARYEVRPLPWRAFAASWLGKRLTYGYLGNILAIVPDYSEFDAVIAHGDSLLLPLKRRPVVRVMHGSALREALHASSVARGLLQLGVYAQELATGLILPGTVAVSENARRDNPFVRRVIPNGVDVRLFNPLAAPKSPQPSIVFVGALDGRKRGRFLVDVFASEVRPRVPDATLTVVGDDGPVAPGVTYLRGVEDSGLAALYARSWVYASPSTYEGFGLPYLEAMASGTAVVAVPNAGSLEVLEDGQSGRLVEPQRFGGAIVDLLRDAPARAALEARGLDRARQLSADVMVERYETLLQRLVHADVRSAATA